MSYNTKYVTHGKICFNHSLFYGSISFGNNLLCLDTCMDDSIILLRGTSIVVWKVWPATFVMVLRSRIANWTSCSRKFEKIISPNPRPRLSPTISTHNSTVGYIRPEVAMSPVATVNATDITMTPAHPSAPYEQHGEHHERNGERLEEEEGVMATVMVYRQVCSFLV